MRAPLLRLLFLVVVALARVARASVWDPHVWPETPPYFEGWYFRATLLPGDAGHDYQQQQLQQPAPDTVALIFAAGKANSSSEKLPDVYIGLLHGDGRDGVTRVYEATPPLASVVVKHRGSNVTTEPEWRTEPEFSWRAEGGGGSLFALVDGRHMVLRAEAGAGAATLWAEVEVADWAYDGGGVPRPHSWTDVADVVPLHWYIHSLASRLTYLRLELDMDRLPPPPGQAPGASRGKRTIEASWPAAAPGGGGGGLVHLEKNWGSRFPKAWVWAQGVHALPAAAAAASSSQAPPRSVAFVLSVGETGHEGVFTHFGHFRDETLGLAWDFRPDNSFLTASEVDGCAGEARVVLHGFDPPVAMADGTTHRPRRRLALDMRRPNGTAACLLGPTGRGFERLCEESFQATARVTATLDGRLVRSVTMERVAFELGGAMLCNGQCSGSSTRGSSTTTAAAVTA